MDPELAAVIHMRAQQCMEKGNQLIVLSFDKFSDLIDSAPSISKVTKLSFLHHGHDEFGYLEGIGDYIDKLSDLKEIVLRGCGTAEAPNKKTEVIYDVKKVDVSYKKQAPIQGNNQMIIHQKEMEDNSVMTKISWMRQDLDGSFVREVYEFEGLEKITTKKLSDNQLQKLAKIPNLPLLKYSNEYINAQRNMFLNPNQALNPEQFHSIKHSLRRARTEAMDSTLPAVSYGSLLNAVLRKMTQEQKSRVTVKGYVGGYNVVQGRVLPVDEHGQSAYPKAVRGGGA